MSFDSINNQKNVEIFSEQYRAKIYYSLNGSEPDTTSFLYESLIPVSEQDSIIRAGIFEDGKLIRALSKFDLSK